MLLIHIDGMDQWKCSIPGFFSKEESQRFKIRLTGVVVHGLADPFFVYINQNHLGETNTNIHCIIDILDKVDSSPFYFICRSAGTSSQRSCVSKWIIQQKITGIILCTVSWLLL